MKRSHAYKGYASFYNVDILIRLILNYNFKDTEFAMR